ncbi:antibiotic biosynthesis monooxygenase family protein [Streptomyces sp. NPDC060322]|uniref:antibiotic biosynthesis monooxygenase family protein n=1 Tax=unclassified Streptomyces TaxID=2593676 RepID=UPI0036515102
MPKISTADGHLVVLNLFTTDAPEKQESLLNEMRKIVDSATYEGWISSTVHAGVASPGTANFIQWRSGEDLEKRYAGEEFKHRTLPVFGEITTSIRLLQNELAYTDSVDGVTEIHPDRNLFTAITVFGVEKENQDALVQALGPDGEFLKDVPGYRSHTVLRGLAARGLEGSFVVSYSQWDSAEAFGAYQAVAREDRPAARQKAEALIGSLLTSVDANTYNVVHTRGAGE